MTIEQQDALAELSEELGKEWANLPVAICNAWERFENEVPEGEFRDRLRGESVASIAANPETVSASGPDYIAEARPILEKLYCAADYPASTPLSAPRRIMATFTAQAWINDYAVGVDPEGPTQWDVTAEILAMGKDAAQALIDDRHESDALRLSENAPQRIKDWSGPFYVEVAGSIAEYFDEEE